ncbi:MAG: hypothetical protein ACOCUW_03170 [Gemmatimonadota bacterium]
MPRQTNPYRNEEAWAKAAENLGKMMAGPDQTDVAQAEALTAETMSTLQEDRINRRRERALKDAADVYGREMGGDPYAGASTVFDPESLQGQTPGVIPTQEGSTGGASDVFGEMGANLIRAGELDNVGEVQRAQAGRSLAAGEIDPDQMRAFMAGAGQEPGPDMALSGGRADMVSARNAQEDRQEAAAQGRANNPVGTLYADLVRQGDQGRADQVGATGLGNAPDPLDTALLDAVRSGDEGTARQIATYGLGNDVPGPEGGGRAESAEEVFVNAVNEGDWDTAERVADTWKGRGGQEPVDVMDMTRYQDATGKYVNSAYSDLVEDSPADAARLTSEASRIGRESGFDMMPGEAVERAAQQLGGVTEAQDNWPVWMGGSGDVEARLGGGDRNQGQGQNRPAGQQGQSDRDPDETVLIAPDGKEITRGELRDTADRRGMDPAEVMERLKQNGATPAGS